MGQLGSSLYLDGFVGVLSQGLLFVCMPCELCLLTSMFTRILHEPATSTVMKRKRLLVGLGPGLADGGYSFVFSYVFFFVVLFANLRPRNHPLIPLSRGFECTSHKW